MSLVEKLRGLIAGDRRHEAAVLAMVAPMSVTDKEYVLHHCPAELLDIDTANRDRFGDGNGDGHGGGFGGANFYVHGNGFSGFVDPSGDTPTNSCSASGNSNGNGNSTLIANLSETPRSLRLTRACLKGEGMKVGDMYIIKMVNDLDLVAVIASIEDRIIGLGKAVVLTEWGTKQGLSELRTNAKLGIYDNAEGWYISSDFVCVFIPISGQARQEWSQRLAMVCDEDIRTWRNTMAADVSTSAQTGGESNEK